MARALVAAGADSGCRDGGRALLTRAQSLRVMLPLSWRYRNPGAVVAQRRRVRNPELALTAIGGTTPRPW